MKPSDIIIGITKRRRELGLTQDELAKRSGISRRTVIAVEAGEHDIGMRKLIRLLDALGLSLTIKEGRDRPTEEELADLFKEDDE